MGGGACRLGGITLDAHRTGHHVLRHPGTDIAVDSDRGTLVHTGAEVARMTVNLHRQLLIKPAGNIVLARWLEHLPLTLGAAT